MSEKYDFIHITAQDKKRKKKEENSNLVIFLDYKHTEIVLITNSLNLFFSHLFNNKVIHTFNSIYHNKVNVTLNL